MKKNLSIAYSTCPNDTFLFHALAHGCINTKDLSYSVDLDDVETLNLKALKNVYDISKLSFAAIGQLQESYGLLRTGAALGRGCGPLLVAKPGYKLKDMKNKQIAVPGLLTTANMLLGLWRHSSDNVAPMTFDAIMPALVRGEYDFGLIIHEGRFTYMDYGLECVVDLGQWWEKETSLPIPLGGIAIKRNLPVEIIKQVETNIGDSVRYGFDNRDASESYIKKHAQELSDEVIRQHIDLYVNQYTLFLGEEGEKAVEFLFEQARKKGVMAPSNKPVFAC